MFTLSYKNRKEEFDKIEVSKIKEKFDIPARKNLYRINEKGDLEKLDDQTAPVKLKNNDELDALSDFTLGAE
ncbi:MAG: hypothetical protein A2014_04355 [Spirochaetes bacterium GWF1_49_6]|nr:MAG: hypothetical protein A2014_04355 [Spirochaetes bacterium GWF1_49_6]